MTRRITDELLIRRSEHNDDGLAHLEELSLHQQHLGRIEYINRVCADLRILLLQDNCIGRIENLKRLRRLEYLNLAMNNIEVIENLECCESLIKLDLTLNFVGKLTSIQHLKDHVHLKELYLVGNPCSQFKGYREFVVATLTQLTSLDGLEISRSEKIRASQRLKEVTEMIGKQEEEYLDKRVKEKETIGDEIQQIRKEYDDPDLDEEEKRRRFYQSKSRHTPEYRLESSRMIHKFEEDQEKARDPFRDEEWERRRKKRNEQRQFDDNGKALNMNQAGIDFVYDDSDPKELKVELKLFKHLTTDQIDLDIHPTFLRVKIKDKLFQLRFLETVHCEGGKAERSQVTGHLIITMPKTNPMRSTQKELIAVEHDDEIPPLEDIQ